MVIDADELERAREAAPAMLALLKAINRSVSPDPEMFEAMVRSSVLEFLVWLERPNSPLN